LARKKTRKTINLLIQLLPILFLSLAIIQTTQIARAQTTDSPWGLKLQVLNSQNETETVFNPFDQIQLRANVTYNNASQPDVLVTFAVAGPSVNSTSNAGNPIRIVRIEMTQANGEAEFSFRIPTEAQNEDTLIGTWNATATISGTPPQSTSFTTQWALTTTTINLLNTQGKSQSTFSPGSNIEVQLEISNNGPALPANITVNMQDPTGQTVNQTETLNTQIASSNQTQTQQTIIQVPSNASAGQASINVAIYKGTYNGTDIPAAENQTATFTVSSSSTTPPPTPTPTASSSPTPSPTPTVLQNTVSLFSWLLVATGLFTFTMLYVGLRRKATAVSPQTGTQPPNMPITATPTVEPKSQSPTIQQPPPTARSTPENQVRATTIGQTPPLYETWLGQAGLSSDGSSKPDLKQPTPEEAAQSIASHLRKISETGKKVQALETFLKAEREQLNNEITDLNKILEDQQRAIMGYFDSIRQAVATAANAQPEEENDGHHTQPNHADRKQDPAPQQTNNKPDNQQAQNPTNPNVATNPNPTPVKDDHYSQPNLTEQSNTTQSFTLNTQPKVNIGQETQPTETDKTGTQTSEKMGAAKNMKGTSGITQREERTQEEDIKVAEHTKED